MKVLHDPKGLLADGLIRIRDEFSVPTQFPTDVLETADRAVSRPLGYEHIDRTDWHFVTLDPASSTDLDQAFAIEASGPDWLLHYAIADVPWFVQDGDAIDTEAWQRGTTVYLPNHRATLYPPVLSEGAASLLPDVERPAIILTTRITPNGESTLENVERARIRSRAKLAYETVQEHELPDGFAQIAERITKAEQVRGASKIDPPEQELSTNGEGHFILTFRPMLESEVRNSALSLAANLAVAKSMLEAETGLFRVMPSPDEKAIERLRATASALNLKWPATTTLEDFERTLSPNKAPEAAFMMAIRRAGNGASYKPFDKDTPPWHSAIAAPYAHTTAPLRRLADRYVLQAVLALFQGNAIPKNVEDAFTRLPKVMARSANRDSRIERAVIDLAEVVILQDHEGRTFSATVTDFKDEKAKLQFNDMPIIAEVKTPSAFPGETIQVRLNRASPEERTLELEKIA